MRILPVTVAWPQREPVTLEQLRLHTRFDDTSEDRLLQGYLAAARSHVERLIGRPIVPRTMRATFESWPSYCGSWNNGPGLDPFFRGYTSAALPGALLVMVPVTSVDAISYTAVDQTTVAWPAGQWLARTSPGGVTRIRPASGVAWPTLGVDPLITIDVTSGFAVVPHALVVAILMLAAHFHLNREEVLTGARISAVQLPLGVADLVAPFRWQWVS
jgi:hypothetical protein